MFELLGNGMTKASGVFTFPSTGKWEVQAQAFYMTGSSTSNDNWAIIQTTHDNSTWQDLVQAVASGDNITAVTSPVLIDVTDTANDKVRMVTLGNGTLLGVNTSTAQPVFATGIIFKKLGKT